MVDIRATFYNKLLHRDKQYGYTSKKSYFHQLCVDIGCREEELKYAMAYRDGWRARVSVESVLSARLGYDENSY